ncbi:uncharacterized protein Hap1MRO34_016572 [Clarias gariepinus]
MSMKATSLDKTSPFGTPCEVTSADVTFSTMTTKIIWDNLMRQNEKLHRFLRWMLNQPTLTAARRTMLDNLLAWGRVPREQRDQEWNTMYSEDFEAFLIWLWYEWIFWETGVRAQGQT